MHHRSCPNVSVVTITLNNREGLRSTMASVFAQTYPAVEYIIVDGQSTDGSVELIESQAQRIARWVSEPDNGIYDALNKGIALSQGEWIIFMNAGDVFFDASTLRTVFANPIAPGAVFLYGHHHTRYPDHIMPRTAGALRDFWRGPPFSHQALLVRSAFQKAHRYNVRNRIAADFELLFGAFQRGHGFQAIDTPIAIVAAGGVSDRDRLQSIWSHYGVVRAFDASTRVHAYYLGAALACLLKQVIAAVLPRSWTDRIRRHRHLS